MPWEDFMPDNAPVEDVTEYREELKQLAKRSSNLGEPYITKLEAEKLNILAEYRSILEGKNFEVTIENSKNIVAKSPKVTMTLWEEQEEDDHLILNFIKPDGTYWGFQIDFDPTPSDLKRLREYATWYVDENEELQTFKDTKNTKEYYQEEVRKVSNLVEEKEYLSKRLDLLKFDFSIWQSSSKLGSFKTFKEALDFAVSLGR
jgi:hypothetical protein